MSKKQHEPEELTEESIEESSQAPAEEDYQLKWQRALADLENIRKRAEQDRQNLTRYALEGFIEELLPVIDNFYRATEHVPEEQKNSAWVTGIQYIQKNLLDVLEQRGVKEISVKPGDHFDPERHHAIGTVEGDQDDLIAEVSNRGYLLHDRVLRPAQVIVTKHS